MKLLPVTPAKSLNKAYLKQSVKRDQIELFKANLVRLFERIRSDEHEEHLKNIVADFLKDTWYKPTFEINTSKRADMVIHTGKSSDDPVGVIIETKKPSNRAEMITLERPNTKALHELLHYYMQERYIRDNKEIKRLIICNIYEWYIFDAVDFERFFFNNQKLVKSYKDWNDGLLVSTNTDWFYQEIARAFIEKELDELPCVYFNLKEYERVIRNPDKVDDKKLINLYKLLSPPHLLKQPFANDSNSLNKEFYNELLHLIGLEEVKEKGKKLIRRRAEGERLDGSLLENTINVLRTRNKVGAEQAVSEPPLQTNDLYFETALELCITWLNRLLFLKLLEGQLIAFHKGDRAYAFLNCTRIADFDELNELFFEVLAVRVDERSPSVRDKFGNIPYLNSSLFEESDLERATIRINELKNRLDLPLHAATVLKTTNGKRLSGSKNTLAYLFEFLDAYDFSNEGSAEIQEQNKTIINASVLGLIFEKINGYRDGSFFTPGFITMYICRETIRRAILRKFNERYGWSCNDLTELYNNLDKISIKDANKTINSLKTCDPAVGSGHFLVSALNEIIAVKSYLGILADKDGKRLRGYDVTVENDELIISHDEQLFVYNYKDTESQRVQETLFHEKETIIENCLFGVDINPKSVAICRLRLWIELLKNAYYRSETKELETLPNIDINIKCGNSLVSRFAVAGNPNAPATQRNKLKELTAGYRDLVLFYKHSPSNKAELRKRIDNLKHDLENFGLPNDKDLVALRKKKNELAQLSLFAYDKKEATARQKLQDDVDTLEKRFADKESSIYRNAFEWRFEFPEVLDEAGEFTGFDVVIGNPPYIRIQDLKKSAPHEVVFQKECFRAASKGNYDIYVVFVERGLTLLGKLGSLGYILPHKFFNSQYGEPLRQFIADGKHLSEIIHFGQHQVFDEATTYTCLLFLDKQRTEEFNFVRIEDLTGWRSGCSDAVKQGVLPSSIVTAAEWNFASDSGTALFERLARFPVKLNIIADRMAQGIRTSANEVYVLDVRADNGETITAYSKHLNRDVLLERQAVSSFLQGRKIKPYQVLPSGKVVIVPYRIDDGRPKLILQQEYQQNYPKTWSYLTENKQYLENREHGKMKGENWYAYVYPKNIEVMQASKILVPDIADRASFAIDKKGEFAFTSGYGITLKQEVQLSPKFILALLNSRLLDFFLKRVSTPMRGGFFRYFTQFISQLPIPPLDLTIAKDKNRHDYTIVLVDQILAAKEAYPHADTSDLDRQVDLLVYDLYGLTEEEIALVEGKALNTLTPCTH